MKMQTHEDSSHLRNELQNELRNEFLRSLREKAERMGAAGQSTITGGSPDERPLAEWKSRMNGMYVRHMPDDEHGIMRISVGGGEDTPVTLDYCTIRGGVGKCIALLERAIEALKESPE